MTLPDPPMPLTRPDEYAFGDDIAAADERLAARAGAALGSAAGRPREVHYVAPPGTDLDRVKHYYSVQASEAGWSEVRSLGPVLRPGEGGFGFIRGEQAFALVWLTAKPGQPTPITVIRVG